LDVPRQYIGRRRELVVELDEFHPNRHQFAKQIRIQRFFILDVIVKRRLTQTGTLGNGLSGCTLKAMLAEFADGCAADRVHDFIACLFYFGARLALVHDFLQTFVLRLGSAGHYARIHERTRAPTLALSMGVGATA
jgi:hypothetical protein